MKFHESNVFLYWIESCIDLLQFEIEDEQTMYRNARKNLENIIAEIGDDESERGICIKMLDEALEKYRQSVQQKSC